MSEFFQKHKPSPNRHTGGFTLLEILVVLTLVGLLTAFSLPQFSVIRDRIEFTLNRDAFENELRGLSYAAFKEGTTLILAGQYPRGPGDAPTEDTVFTDKEPVFLEPGQLRPMRPTNASDVTLTLPEEWRVTVDSPIIYQASGFCGGGTVNLLIGQLRYAYALKAPTCQVELAN